MLMQASGVEILCLQQVNLYSSDASLLCEMMGPSWFVCVSHRPSRLPGNIQQDRVRAISTTAGAQCGLVVFSRFRIIAHQVIDLDNSTGTTQQQRGAAMLCTLELPDVGHISIVNCVLNESQESVRLLQMMELSRVLRQLGAPSPGIGHVLCGALNGIARGDYSDGAWEILNRERKEYKLAGDTQSGELPSCHLMTHLLSNCRLIHDCLCMHTQISNQIIFFSG